MVEHLFTWYTKRWVFNTSDNHWIIDENCVPGCQNFIGDEEFDY